MRKDEKGYIVVETICAFIMLVLLMMSILLLINITTVQARMHYALTQTADELSMYCYVIDAMGLTDDLKTLDEDGQETQETIDGVVDNVENIQDQWTNLQNVELTAEDADFMAELDTVMTSLSSMYTSAEEIGSVVENALDDIEGTFIDLVRYGVYRAEQWAVQELVMRPMLEKYLQNGNQSALSYLQGYNVVTSSTGNMESLSGLDLSKSRFIDSNGDITITVNYEINYGKILGALPLPDDLLTIQVEQTAKTKAWLGGAENDG